MGRYVSILLTLLALSGLAHSCQVISSEGTTTLSSDATGANPLSGVYYISQACIVIASSNVTLDCDGYSITNNGTADAAGIVVNGSTALNYTNVTIQNCPIVSGYERGIYLHNTSQDTIINSSAYGGTAGIQLYSSSYNTITNNTGYGNSHGFYIHSSSGNNLTDNMAYDNSFYGFQIYLSSSTALTSDTAYNNTQFGIFLFSGPGTNITNCTLYKKQSGLYAYNSNYTMQSTAFLPESGAFVNYTNLSITDTMGMGGSEAYYINWSDFSGSMPSNRSSFARKYVNITTQAGTPSIDEITFHWLTSELSGYSETYFELWKFNSSTGWTLLNNASDTTNNELKLYDLDPSSIYGILESNESGCRVISYPGTYTLLNNISGTSPISGLNGGISHACTVISSSNVTFDCNGYSITNNGTAAAVGIVVNGSTAINYTNVTIQNCPSISQFERGIYLHYTAQDMARNSTAHNNTRYGIYIYHSDYSTVVNNTAFNNSLVGFIFWSSSYSLFANNTAYNNTYSGFYLSSTDNSAIYNNLTNNTAYGNSPYGFTVYSGSNNTITGSTIYNNTYGFLLYSYAAPDSNTTIASSTVYDNSEYGFWLYPSRGYHIANCTLYNNRYGIYANDSNYTMEGTSFLPASGEFTNYANLSITDNMSASEEYTVNWSAFASSPPAGYLSFAQKYANITTQAGSPSIDEITFHWLTSELSASGYIESYFELWKFNTSSGWTVLNETPDTTNNHLKLYALSPSSIYGILQIAVESEGGDTGGGGTSECNTDSDCGECYYCSVANGKCAILSTAECTKDEGCAAGYNCTGCKCVQAGCTSDSDCSSGEYCATPNCLALECECAYIENHNCIPYECCADSGCPAGYSCRDNSCVQTPAQEPGSGEGEDGEGDGGSGTGGTVGNITGGQEEPQTNATEPSQHEAEVPSASEGEEGAGAMGGSSEPLDVVGAAGIVLVLLIVAGIVYFFYSRKG